MPYSDLPPSAFWKLCRDADDFRLADLYQPKFALEPGMRIATAGSCFAQNIARYVRGSALSLVDVEPAPALMPADVARRFGYGLYSARYGNIYTTRQLRQLLEDAEAEQVHGCAIWARVDRLFDALRPNVEPDGFASEAALRRHRLSHLALVRQMFAETDVFVFTLGLTECWEDRATGRVFPTAPGVIAGQFDANRHGFLNLTSSQSRADLDAAIALIRSIAPHIRILLTVSPVPLTATAAGQHVLTATTYSKSVLRAVAQEVADQDDRIDYMPSYEIITGSPFAAQFYNDNLRTVTQAGIDTVMSVFFGAHPGLGDVPAPVMASAPRGAEGDAPDEAICEEALLEAFAKS
ncbi:GSCFA domain-containing protein [Pseudoprimorskyibacter insulae]|uniref:GSCFA domain-containing protein n=1 Tax=Pseudoprimorskyibacter insulae TaxID=1695997 RepID=A0A2R8ANU2_9RHOB|nr:GSCFA domain-containing protein [Pseudoprimorskyibacter insulae]SPF77693.1 hypothetical protein PRI8871_00277 [Pseudoprimorskyibacter insulae]